MWRCRGLDFYDEELENAFLFIQVKIVPRSTVCLPHWAVCLPRWTVCLPRSTVNQPRSNVSLPRWTVSLPRWTVCLPRSTVCLPRSTVCLPCSTALLYRIYTPLNPNSTADNRMSAALNRGLTYLCRMSAAFNRGTPNFYFAVPSKNKFCFAVQRGRARLSAVLPPSTAFHGAIPYLYRHPMGLRLKRKTYQFMISLRYIYKPVTVRKVQRQIPA